MDRFYKSYFTICDLIGEVEESKPLLLVLAFPCSVWSPMMHLNRRTPVATLQARERGGEGR